MNIAAVGIQTASRQFASAASDVVTAASAPTAGGPDLPGAIVGLDQSAFALRANVRVFQISSSMFKSMLEILG